MFRSRCVKKFSEMSVRMGLLQLPGSLVMSALAGLACTAGDIHAGPSGSVGAKGDVFGLSALSSARSAGASPVDSTFELFSSVLSAVLSVSGCGAVLVPTAFSLEFSLSTLWGKLIRTFAWTFSSLIFKCVSHGIKDRNFYGMVFTWAFFRFLSN